MIDQSTHFILIYRIDFSEPQADKMVLKLFNEQGKRALGSFTLLLQLDGWKIEKKFHIIEINTSFNVLLGKPQIHENNMVPSSLHQYFKFVRSGLEYFIKGDLMSFSIHEINIYKDAAY